MRGQTKQLKNFLYQNVKVGYTLITLPSLASATASCSVISDANTFLRTFFSPLPIFPSTDAVAAWGMGGGGGRRGGGRGRRGGGEGGGGGGRGGRRGGEREEGGGEGGGGGRGGRRGGEREEGSVSQWMYE